MFTSSSASTRLRAVVCLTLATAAVAAIAGCGGPPPCTASAATTTSGPRVAAWRAIPPAPVEPGGALASAWTGTQLVVVEQPYGGVGPVSAAAYDPHGATWRRLQAPPDPRAPYPGSRAFWTGREVVVMNAATTLVYDPRSDRWRSEDRGHPGLIAWTGRELVAWGGGCCGDAFSDGVAYDPARRSWRTLARSPLAGSQGPIGAWTGRELLVFVGDRNLDTGRRWPARLARAAAYDPRTNRWRRIARLPEERSGATVAWARRELLVVGGRTGPGRGRLRADGLAYDPETDRWRRIASMPAARDGAAAAWTGGRLLVWGGAGTFRRPSRQGLSYDPMTDRWSSLPLGPLRARTGAEAIWTGRDLLLWGGYAGTRRTPLLDGAILRP